ncbi:oligosaccharide biosynthesis protein Alg14-like protein [Irpex rosettiformis]|uniref:Oligosaccharide biosynthesis protein Alg14-like protein n=1 Tax=Irpex rosettiformis TaxID=378272 RepID=A0ACB8UFK5_9APHY|nr:oligosaccharide biosynthesis protein Alg14-like protein [Irpex rosettiformis]
MHPIALAILLTPLGLLLRLYAILPQGKPTKRGVRLVSEPCKLGMFLGSGGHTTEALTLLSSLDFARYSPRTYIVSCGDTLSAKKAVALESLKASEILAYSVITIPRARRVHQSLLTTPLTSMQSLATCVYHITLSPLITGVHFADVLLLNGPGTCVIVCIAVYINRFLGLHSPKLVYVESFARVRRLSLSGKILRFFVDRFVVQWPELAAADSKAEYRGWLV